jgi:prepilin-type N-terminal cleavage/methylation domain-containing protein
MQTNKGFTLIELLVVIAILAVLATAVVVVLNPAQLVKQGRDSTRISDLAAIHSALALYLSDVASPSFTATTTCTATSTGGAHPTGFTTAQVNASTTVGTTAWVNVNFSSISSGSPLARLPIDPVNDATYHYCYKSSSTLIYELDANMESSKYGGGSSDVEAGTKDGGNDDNWYEIGNAPGLNL